MENKKSPVCSQSGFTLIELSIVLVILGLLIGGILVGSNLISLAGVRATVAQVERYNASVYTFKTRYDGIPGDMDNKLAAKFSMTPRSGAVGHGDGNTLIEGCSAGATQAGCETLLFWSDLSVARLIDGNYSNATDALTQINNGFQDRYFPPSKMRRGSYITVFNSGGVNYYEVAGIVSTDAAGDYTMQYAMSPNEAFNMDNKVDDGFPLTGHFRGMEDNTTLGVTATPSATGCVSDVTGNPYNMVPAYSDMLLCHVRFRMQQ